MNNIQEDIYIIYEQDATRAKELTALSGIYMLVLNGKRYIGSSYQLYRRIYDHLNCLKRDKHPNKYLQNAYNKYGESSLKMFVLEVVDKESLILREQYYLDSMKPEYNISPVAGSPVGSGWTEESKRKFSISRTGKKQPQEMKDKISRLMKGVPKSKEHVEKIKANYRRERFIEPIVAINVKTGQEYYFDSVVKCQNILGVYQASISRILAGKKGTYSSKGYTFRKLRKND